ncbi:MAG: hypothetical protein QM687_08920 [Ferruginibacter sp.]
MKKLLSIAAVFVMLFAGMSSAMAQTSARKNIVNQPGWGPTGYDYARYYYFPDKNVYYDVNKKQYIVNEKNKWVYTSTLPKAFDPSKSYKVVVNQDKPYNNNAAHKREYSKFKGQGPKQAMIKDSKEDKYFESNDHPRHKEFKAQPQPEKKDNRNRRN